jgi:hypothetical protein
VGDGAELQRMKKAYQLDTEPRARIMLGLRARQYPIPESEHGDLAALDAESQRAMVAARVAPLPEIRANEAGE